MYIHNLETIIQEVNMVEAALGVSTIDSGFTFVD